MSKEYLTNVFRHLNGKKEAEQTEISKIKEEIYTKKCELLGLELEHGTVVDALGKTVDFYAKHLIKENPLVYGAHYEGNQSGRRGVYDVWRNHKDAHTQLVEHLQNGSEIIFLEEKKTARPLESFEKELINRFAFRELQQLSKQILEDEQSQAQNHQS